MGIERGDSCQADVLRRALQGSLEEGPQGARRVIAREWPLEHPQSTVRKPLSRAEQLSVFYRDRFTCRYCGKRVVFVPALRLLSTLLPEDFPYHPNWKWRSCHQAYWCLAACLDHLVPIARGGSNTPDNVVVCCDRCNGAKSCYTLAELGWELRDPPPGDWDGLASLFMRAMKACAVKDKGLRSWYNALQRHLTGRC